LVLGGLILLSLSRRQKHRHSEKAGTTMRSDDQQQRLEALLGSQKRGSE